MSVEILQAREDLMKSIQTFFKKFNRISLRETPKVLSLAWEKFFEIQHAQPEDIHELLHKFLEDLQIISEELAEYINSLSWNCPTFYDDDDDEYELFVYNQDSCYEQNFVDNSQSPSQTQYETYSCELCGNDAHYGYDSPPQFPFVYNRDPCFNQDFDNNFPQTSPSFPQQYLCYENCGGPHETF
nr:hypothetical protein [Tanacetum cinerariifolium]